MLRLLNSQIGRAHPKVVDQVNLRNQKNTEYSVVRLHNHPHVQSLGVPTAGPGSPRLSPHEPGSVPAHPAFPIPCHTVADPPQSYTDRQFLERQFAATDDVSDCCVKPSPGSAEVAAAAKYRVTGMAGGVLRSMPADFTQPEPSRADCVSMMRVRELRATAIECIKYF